MTIWGKVLAALSENPGSIIGGGVALVRSMDMLRQKAWDWAVFASYMVAMPLGGHVGWQIATVAGMNELLRIIFTIFTAANVFIITAAITDQEVFQAVMRAAKKRFLINGAQGKGAA